MTVSLCIRQGSKRNDDSVSVEELDWSAESQLNTSGVTSGVIKHQWLIHSLYGQKYWDTNFFRRETVATKKFMYLNIVFPPLLQQFWSVWKDCTHMSSVFGDEFVAHLKSHQRCSAVCRKFFYTDWIIISLWSLSYTQRHCHVRIEKGPVQTVDIQSEAHNFLEYHYMIKH